MIIIFRIAVVKAGSLAASWALAHVKNHTGEKYWEMYKVIRQNRAVKDLILLKP